MDMSYGASFLEEAPDAYERLLLDAMVGDPTLFIRSDEVDQAWQIVDPLLTTWEQRPGAPRRLRGRNVGTPPGRPAHRARRATVANAVAVDTWDAQGVRLSDIVAALADLRHQSVGKNAARTAVMTLVAVVPADEQAYAATRALRALGRHHPARIVLLRPDPDQVATLDGRAALYAVDADGHQVNFEEVTLVVGGQAANHLDSLVEAFTLSDLPVPVWYAGDVPQPTDPLLSVATTVLIDSRDAADPASCAPCWSWPGAGPSWICPGSGCNPGGSCSPGCSNHPNAAPGSSRCSRSRSAARSVPASSSAGGWPPNSAWMPRQVQLVDSRHVEVRVVCRRDGQTATFEVGRGELHRTVAARA
jgi:hypothetical protein